MLSQRWKQDSTRAVLPSAAMDGREHQQNVEALIGAEPENASRFCKIPQAWWHI
jgi:hypothetical protein